MSFKIFVILGALLVGTGYVLGDNDHCYPYSSSTSCKSNQVCCNQQCVYGVDCSGRTCNDIYSDPCSGLFCCDGVCRHYCDDYYTDYTVPIIIGIVAGACFFVCILSVIIYCICRKRRRNPNGGYVITHPQGQVYTATPAAHFNQVTTYPTGQPYGQQGYGQANRQCGYGAI